MKRIRDLHLFLASYQKQKGDENACEDDDDGGFFIFGRPEGQNQPDNYGDHRDNDHQVNQAFEELGISFPSGDCFGLVFGQRIDFLTHAPRPLLVGVHPPEFLHQRLGFAFILLAFGIQDEIKTRNQIHSQQRRNKTAEVQVDAAQIFHLFDLARQRDEQLLADKQAVGVESRVGLEDLRLGDLAG